MRETCSTVLLRVRAASVGLCSAISAMSSLPRHFLRCARSVSGRSSRCTTTPRSRSRARRSSAGRRISGAIASCCRLPVEPRTGFNSGFTPLVRATRLGERLGLNELYIKDDSVNHPTLSYKDRVVSVAATRALELGFDVLACASTGNLANSVASHAARLGVECVVFIPDNLEASKVLGSAIYRPTILAIAGNYDDVNRLCTQVGDRYGWGFVNINLRAYYAEGAKTMGFEIVEQLGWKYPKHIVSPVAGATLLPRILRGLRELQEVGLVSGDLPHIHAAQAAGCAPVINALNEGLDDHPEPVRPNTIAKSLAIGNPADGFPGPSGDSIDGRRRRGGQRSPDRRRDSTARGNRRHLHRAGGRDDAGRDDRSGPPRRHRSRRIRRRLRHGERLQDDRGDGRSDAEAGEPRPRVQGIRSVVRVAGRRPRPRSSYFAPRELQGDGPYASAITRLSSSSRMRPRNARRSFTCASSSIGAGRIAGFWALHSKFSP